MHLLDSWFLLVFYYVVPTINKDDRHHWLWKERRERDWQDALLALNYWFQPFVISPNTCYITTHYYIFVTVVNSVLVVFFNWNVEIIKFSHVNFQKHAIFWMVISAFFELIHRSIEKIGLADNFYLGGVSVNHC